MLRAGVVGAGSMGANHARVYASLTGGCELVGVYDVDADRAAAVAARWGGTAFPSLDALLERVDVVSIASPTSFHVEHAERALCVGVHVLVEKPLARTPQEARRLVELALRLPRHLVAQVGHVEEFNPAVAELRKLLPGEGEVIAIDVERLSPYDPRIGDIDVVQDLMLHDLHVLLSLVTAPVATVQSAVRHVHSEAFADYAAATLIFADGVIATLAASRVTEEKVRRLTVSTTRSNITVDYLRRTIEISRSARLTADGQGSRTYRQESVVERVFVPMEEPLVAQISAFLDAVRRGDRPRVPLSTGVRCLELAERITREAAVALPATRRDARAA